MPIDQDAAPILIHGAAVSLGGKGLLILGPSGSGKSSLALRLIALGATLIADDQVLVKHGNQGPLAGPPDTLAGLIEARQVGILHLPHLDGARIDLVVDLSEPQIQRLPPHETTQLAGFTLPLIKASQIDYLAPALFCYLMGDRRE